MIDHYLRPKVATHCERGYLSQYERFVDTTVGIPWDLMSFIAGCKPGDSAWVLFVLLLFTRLQAELTAWPRSQSTRRL